MELGGRGAIFFFLQDVESLFLFRYECFCQMLSLPEVSTAQRSEVVPSDGYAHCSQDYSHGAVLI